MNFIKKKPIGFGLGTNIYSSFKKIIGYQGFKLLLIVDIKVNEINIPIK